MDNLVDQPGKTGRKIGSDDQPRFTFAVAGLLHQPLKATDTPLGATHEKTLEIVEVANLKRYPPDLAQKTSSSG